MRKQILPGTDLAVSRFSFGTASLFNAGGAKRRARLLAAAYEHGFTHFDTAPYYGFGTAERDLKSLLAAHPDITVATKVGLYAPGGEDQLQASVFLRKAAGRLVRAFSRPQVDWSVSRARGALTGSLRRLGRERIDLYLLHEPDIALINSEEWLRWLESERDRVAHFGIAVNALRLGQCLASDTPLARVVQTIDSLTAREADMVLALNRPLQLSYGYVSAARRAGPADVPTILSAALRRNFSGSIIVSTTRVQRLSQYEIISAAVDSAKESPWLP
jgi:D-threo-aldose 1-dehydrogenase